jgi:hypothetical protein
MFAQPGGRSLRTPVGKHIDDRVTLAIGEKSAKDLTLSEGKVIDAQDAGCRMSGRDSRVSAPEQGVSTRPHRTPLTVSCAGFPSKSKREIAERHIEPNRPLCGDRNKIG